MSGGRGGFLLRQCQGVVVGFRLCSVRGSWWVCLAVQRTVCVLSARGSANTTPGIFRAETIHSEGNFYLNMVGTLETVSASTKLDRKRANSQEAVFSCLASFGGQLCLK